jgi:hypothetical protein
LGEKAINLWRYFSQARREHPEIMPSTVAAGEKAYAWIHNILPYRDFRETPASPAKARGTQMKTITLRIPDVEAAMLVEVQKTNKTFRDPQELLLGLIRQEY